MAGGDGEGAVSQTARHFSRVRFETPSQREGEGGWVVWSHRYHGSRVNNFQCATGSKPAYHVPLADGEPSVQTFSGV